jgi:hypothetical protein
LPHTSGGDGGGNGGSDGGDGGNGGSATLTLIDLRATAAGESIAIAGGAPVPESASSVDTAAWNGGSPANGSAFGCSTAACAPSADEAAVSFAEEGSPAGRAAAAASAHASAASRLGGGIECGPSEMLQRGGGANSGKARRRRDGEERNAGPLPKLDVRVLPPAFASAAAARGALRAISAHTNPRRVGRRAKYP